MIAYGLTVVSVKLCDVMRDLCLRADVATDEDFATSVPAGMDCMRSVPAAAAAAVARRAAEVADAAGMESVAARLRAMRSLLIAISRLVGCRCCRFTSLNLCSHFLFR